ncbi:MAG: MFS transporter [Anaerolineae bacterium]|nr:MFS transporter [Anaerolineae bacterium]
MRAFYLVALGQFVSIFGTTMTQFGLTIWTWTFVTEIQPTADPATAMALVGFFSFAPEVLLGPIAGALVDRWNRKLVMVISDVAAGLATIAVFLLYSSGQLQLWHLYAAGAVTSAFKSFQWPAFSAAISTMIPKEQYTRANGILSLTESVSGVLAIPLAGLLLNKIGLTGIMTIDIITFLAAVGGILLVSIPQPKMSAEGEVKNNLWRDSIFGFRYILQRPSLLGLQMVFFFGNLLGSIAGTLLTPMILSRSGNDEQLLSLVQGAFGAGAVVGGLILVRTGGLKRRTNGVIWGWFWSSLFGYTLLGIGRTLPFWMVVAFLSSVVVVYINASNQAIWQAKVAPDLQGRVFSARRLIAQVVGPLGILLAGPLADRIFEPALREGGSLTGVFGWLVGVGPGAGMALILVCCGLVLMVISVIAYRIPAIRFAEDILPDHDQDRVKADAPNTEAEAVPA